MSDRELRQKLKQAFDVRNTVEAPEFDSVFAEAERSYSRPRRRYLAYGGIASAIAIVIVSLSNWQARDTVATDEFLIADSLMNSTGWSAPSDALMPIHRFDIYQEIPLLMESTDLQEGSLL